jgi:hypothetical protein
MVMQNFNRGECVGLVDAFCQALPIYRGSTHIFLPGNEICLRSLLRLCCGAATMVTAGETVGPVLALIRGPEVPRDQPSSLRVAATATFSPRDVGRVLTIPGATVRSWQSRGLIPADRPRLVRQHRYLRAIDAFYLAVLSRMLAAGVGSARAGAVAIAQAVIYGEGKPTGTEGEGRGRLEVDPPSLERIRACQRDDSHAATYVLHRDETAPYWLLYEVGFGGTGETTQAVLSEAAVLAPAAVLPWSSSERYARQHDQFGCLNLTALLARTERGLLTLLQQRTKPAARERT